MEDEEKLKTVWLWEKIPQDLRDKNHQKVSNLEQGGRVFTNRSVREGRRGKRTGAKSWFGVQITRSFPSNGRRQREKGGSFQTDTNLGKRPSVGQGHFAGNEGKRGISGNKSPR